MPCPGKLGLLLFLAGSTLFAQKVISARAGLITYVTGFASIDGNPVVLKRARFPQMRDGETFSTSLRTRAELLLAPGVFLRLSENSQARMDDTQLTETRVTLQRGDALIEVVKLTENNRIQIGLGETITEFTRPGLYRFGIAQNGTGQNTLRVYGGEALVRAGPKTIVVKRGFSADLGPDLAAAKFDRKRTDSLHKWAARRSFDLYMSDPDARERQNHWQQAGGYAENKNYGVVFRFSSGRRLPPPTIEFTPPAERP